MYTARIAAELRVTRPFETFGALSSTKTILGSDREGSAPTANPAATRRITKPGKVPQSGRPAMTEIPNIASTMVSSEKVALLILKALAKREPGREQD
jgi:hypothetical protein